MFQDLGHYLKIKTYTLLIILPAKGWVILQQSYSVF